MERRYVGVQVRGFYFGIPGVVIYLQEVKKIVYRTITGVERVYLNGMELCKFTNN